MSVRLFIPRDAGALAVGADEVAAAIEQAARSRDLALEIVRTGSRGLYWLEPMVEVATPAGRIAYGPVAAAMPRACSMPWLPAGRIRCASVWPTTFPGSSGRPG